MSQSEVISALQREPLSTVGTQERNKEFLPSSCRQTAAIPNGEPWGNSK